MTAFKQGHDPATGRFLPGNSANPGGLSRRQRAITRMLEGLTPKAVKVLAELLDSQNEQIRLNAAKEVIQRIAPPVPHAPKVDVTVQNNIAVTRDTALAQSIEDTMARVALRKRGIDPATILGKPGEQPALPAPDVIDVHAEPVEPADEPDELDAIDPDAPDEAFEPAPASDRAEDDCPI